MFYSINSPHYREKSDLTLHFLPRIIQSDGQLLPPTAQSYRNVNYPGPGIPRGRTSAALDIGDCAPLNCGRICCGRPGASVGSGGLHFWCFSELFKGVWKINVLESYIQYYNFIHPIIRYSVIFC